MSRLKSQPEWLFGMESDGLSKSGLKAGLPSQLNGDNAIARKGVPFAFVQKGFGEAVLLTVVKNGRWDYGRWD